ncbi:hypothetical protein DYBT9275_02727 [Dyadobacter sp. CECT 9275]|uniref:Uncharacterized protein n=1 Tax=Dyadobacter helix TaxID=2822344 RepID=A0A916JCM0_9BACT|nr:hypothetical protein [Dyadobacter sp. CECT 9275]CAG5001714.1 hypothetical protein DYBT9275_02727 [Dyadobacter sp. CECT 9275]
MNPQSTTDQQKALFAHAEYIFATMPGFEKEKDCLIQGALLTFKIDSEYGDFKVSTEVTMQDTVRSIQERLQEEIEARYRYLTDLDSRDAVEDLGRSFKALTMGYSGRLTL